MRPLWTMGLLLLITLCTASGQTIVTGDITTNTTWSPSGSPYIIQSDVTVTNNATLVIQSSALEGVTIAFDGYYGLEADWGSAIIANGNDDRDVVFTSNAPSPAPNDWKWVQVGGPNPSLFNNCTFEYAESGLRPNVASPTITRCTIRNCLSSGLFCAGASPTVQYCDIYNNRDGIGISSPAAAPSNPVINFNNIYDNTHWNVYVFSYDEPDAVINAEYNWWDTDDPEVIANEINDGEDDPSLHVTIDYDPWWTQQPVESRSWSRVKALFNR